MGGNFSVRRDIALRLGGFDEQFVRVAYNFEAEFAHRLRRARLPDLLRAGGFNSSFASQQWWHPNIWRSLEEPSAQSRGGRLLFHFADLVGLAELSPFSGPPAAGYRHTTSPSPAVVDPSDARCRTFRNGLGAGAGRARAALFEFQQMAERRGIQ